MINGKKYNKDYFENGIVKGISGYQNYRWLPELTIKMAHNFIKKLELTPSDKVLDFGCAKGYLVKALRILDINAYGCDISPYAINKVDSDVRDYCKLSEDANKLIPFNFTFDWLITKDVMEHLDEEDIDKIIPQFKNNARKCFHVIPLGKDDKYVVRNYELDKTHCIRKPKEWWIEKFRRFGWKLISFDYKVNGIKDNWAEKYDKGNGFFIFEYGG